MPYLKEQSGTVILLGIIITMVILIIGTGVSVLVISEIKQSKSVDKSITAYYLAEYGVEDGLYEVRKRGKSINNINENDISVGNGTYSRTAFDKKDEIVVDLLKNNEYILINLYNSDAVDADGVIDYHAGIEAFTVECEKTSSTTSDGIEVKIYQLNPNNTTFYHFNDDDIENTKFYWCSSPDDPENYLTHENSSIQSKHAIKIKITATGDAHNLIFKAYTDNNYITQAQIMDKQIIRSSGTYSQTKAGLQAEMEIEPPW
ncbi:MAG: hypothetical protein U9O66_03950 [Patescibacteria group bacterium]|nr:hypothetical protein [Patescibacteria group bacterium]